MARDAFPGLRPKTVLVSVHLQSLTLGRVTVNVLRMGRIIHIVDSLSKGPYEE